MKRVKAREKIDFSLSLSLYHLLAHLPGTVTIVCRAHQAIFNLSFVENGERAKVGGGEKSTDGLTAIVLP